MHHVRRHVRHLWQLIGNCEFVWLGGCAHRSHSTVCDQNPRVLGARGESRVDEPGEQQNSVSGTAGVNGGHGWRLVINYGRLTQRVSRIDLAGFSGCTNRFHLPEEDFQPGC
jgi:hypothetical protein